MSKNNLKDGYKGAVRNIGDAANAGETYVAVDLVNPISTDGLTDAELRASPVPVTTDGLTDAELRASPVPVSTGGLTDAQLRATPVPISGALTDAQLRATPVPVTDTQVAETIVMAIGSAAYTITGPRNLTTATITGTWSGIIALSASNDNVNWTPINAISTQTRVVSSFVTVNGGYEWNTLGYRYLKFTTFTAGTSTTAYVYGSNEVGSVSIINTNTNPVIATIPITNYTTTWTAVGTVGAALSVIDKRVLAITISGAPPGTVLDVLGKITGGTARTIAKITNNTVEPTSIEVAKYDEITFSCSAFGPLGGTATLRASAYAYSSEHEIDNIKQTRTITEGIFAYTAYAKESKASDKDSVWSISRTFSTAGFNNTQWADSGYFTQKLSDRATVFPPVPLTNDKSILLDGVNEYVDVPHSASLAFLDGTVPFSLSCWVKKNGSASGHLMSKLNASVVGYIFTCTDTQVSVVLIQALFVNGISKLFTLPYNIAGKWSNITMTYNGSKLASGVKVYLNGIEVTNTSVSQDNMTTNFANVGNMGFGGVAALPGNNPYNGNLDNLSLWNVELNQTDINNLYDNGRPPNLSYHPRYVATPSSLVSWWRVGESDVYPAINDTIGTNHGTMTNTEAGDVASDAP